MKKHANGVITLILSGILVVTAVGIGGYHCYQGDKVKVKEQIFYGDKKEVAEVSVTQYDTMDYKLVWETTTPLGDSTQAKSVLRQSRNELRAPQVSEGHFDVMYSLSLSGSTSGTFDFYDEDDYYIGQMSSYPLAMLQDVASRVPVGEKYTETVRVADYGDVYTPDVYITFPEGEIPLWMHEDGKAMIAQYFTLPVGEDDMATVTMSHNGVDGISGLDLECNREDGNWEKNIPAAFIGNSIFVATNWDGDIQIHRIDCVPHEQFKNELTVDSMTQVATLPDAMCTNRNGLVVREKEGQLLVLCRDEDEYILDKLYVLSLDTMEVLQEVDVDFFDIYTIYQQDDYMILVSYNGDFLVFEEEGGRYTEALSGNYAIHLPEAEYTFARNITAMDYDHGKLITAFRCDNRYTTRRDGLYVSVNTIQGCVFSASYPTSLNHDVPVYGYSDTWVRQWDDMPLEIIKG